MSDAPIDLNLHRRVDLEARIVRARECLAYADACEVSNVRQVATLRQLSRVKVMGKNPAKEAAEDADAIEAKIAKDVAALRASAAAVLQTLQAELKGVTACLQAR